MATVLAGPRIGEHVACQRGQSKCAVKFAIAQLITNKPVTLTGYLRFPVAAGLFRSNVEHAKRLWFTRDHLAMAQALGWDRVASFYIDLEAPVLPSGIPKPGPLQMHLQLIAFAAWLRGRFRGRVTPPRRAAGPAARARLGKPFVARHVPADREAPLLRPELLQRERQLVVGDALGFAAEIGAADLGDDRLEPFVADDELVALGDDGGTTCALGQEQRAQRVESSGSVSLTSIVARYVLRVYGARPVRVPVAGSECRPLTAIALAATLIPARQLV